MSEAADVTYRFEERIKEWARSNHEIRAVLVVGSQARRDHPADQWADLNLMIFANEFDGYLSEASWLSQMGQVWS